MSREVLVLILLPRQIGRLPALGRGIAGRRERRAGSRHSRPVGGGRALYQWGKKNGTD